MPDVEIRDKTQVTELADGAWVPSDNETTDQVEIITAANLKTQIRGAATTADLAMLHQISASSSEINVLDGITASTAELNILDGVTATASEINKLDGLTATTADLERTASVESAIMGKDEQEAIQSNTLDYSGIVISDGTGTYPINSSSAVVLATLPAITREKSETMLFFVTAYSNTVTLTINGSDSGFIDPEGNKGSILTLSGVDDFVYIKSSCVVGGRWMILGGEGYTLST